MRKIVACGPLTAALSSAAPGPADEHGGFGGCADEATTVNVSALARG